MDNRLIIYQLKGYRFDDMTGNRIIHERMTMFNEKTEFLKNNSLLNLKFVFKLRTSGELIFRIQETVEKS